MNGYARNAGLQFDKGDRDATGHVQLFLETYEDRGLERCLCYVRVKDIHELEHMINGILKSEERGTSREDPAYPLRSRDSSRPRDDKRPEATRALIARIGLTIVEKNSTAVVMTNAMYNGFRWSKRLCPT